MATPGHPDVADHPRVVAVVAAVGGQVEGDRQALLAGRQVAPVERVGLGGGGEPGVLPDRPRLVDVHGRVRPAQERRDAGVGVEEVQLGQVGGGVERRRPRCPPGCPASCRPPARGRWPLAGVGRPPSVAVAEVGDHRRHPQSSSYSSPQRGQRVAAGVDGGVDRCDRRHRRARPAGDPDLAGAGRPQRRGHRAGLLGVDRVGRAQAGHRRCRLAVNAAASSAGSPVPTTGSMPPACEQVAGEGQPAGVRRTGAERGQEDPRPGPVAASWASERSRSASNCSAYRRRGRPAGGRRGPAGRPGQRRARPSIANSLTPVIGSRRCARLSRRALPAGVQQLGERADCQRGAARRRPARSR